MCRTGAALLHHDSEASTSAWTGRAPQRQVTAKAGVAMGFRQPMLRRGDFSLGSQSNRAEVNPDMKIAVFGATGGVGRHVVEQALDAGHAVTALARNPKKLELADPRLVVVTGDVLDAAKVEETLQGADAVVVSLGSTSPNPDYIVSQGTQVIVAAMQRLEQPQRIVVVSSIGVGDSKDQVPFAFKLLMMSVLRKPMEDKERQEALVKASDLDWTIVRPGGLTDGPATGVYQVGTDGKVQAGQITRADVAAFVLKQLSDDTYVRQAPAIS